MRNSKIQVFAKSYGVTDTTVLQIEMLAEKHVCLSDSEVVRRAVAEWHARSFPDYIYQKSAKDIEKRELARKKAEFEKIPEKDYINEHVPGGVYVTDDDGNERYIIFGYANIPNPVLVEGFKEWAENNKERIAYHMEMLNSGRSLDIYIQHYAIRAIEREHDVKLSQLQAKLLEEHEKKKNEYDNA